MILDANHRILVVDDNRAIHEDFRKVLLASTRRDTSLDETEALLFNTPSEPKKQLASFFAIDSAYQGTEALEMVRAAIAVGQPYALAFMDVRMPPGWDGIETIERIWKVDPALQIVVCTAFSDYSWESMSERLGVSDNLVLLKKPFDNAEVLQISHALTRKWLVTRQAEIQLEELDGMVAERTRELEAATAETELSGERFAQAFQNSPIPQAIQSVTTHRFVDVNAAFLRMTGFPREEAVGRTPLELGLCPGYESRFLQGVCDGGTVRDAEAQFSTRTGEVRPVILSLEPLWIRNEPHVLLTAHDITQRVRLEAQLRQSQKLEAIGQLASGVAHDFNNLLTIIQGHASLHAGSPDLPSNVSASLTQIGDAAERAADLTRNLLSFSRRGMIRPRVLDLNETIESGGDTLRKILGDRATLQTALATDLPAILADLNNIEQILMNLTLNGRDAMPGGGTITIGTASVRIDAGGASRHPEARAGEFVRLSVTDTGTGMNETVRSRIFEPFFTTKRVNEGTGMGLATVYGIVSQHEGWLDVETAPGSGSTFHVYLPVTTQAAESSPDPKSAPAPVDRGHTIFVVEDDHAVRSLVAEVLESYNYKVIQAETGDAAIAHWPSCRDNVDLLLTDIVMPGDANGLDVARHCLSSKPDLKVIYTSGYSTELFKSNVELEDGRNYLPKPYLFGKLTAIIQKALNSTAPAILGAAAM